MSSTIDNTTCPNCGGNARTEMDHHTGETNTWCDDGCGYEAINGEVVSEGSKVTVFVSGDDYYNVEGEN